MAEEWSARTRKAHVKRRKAIPVGFGLDLDEGETTRLESVRRRWENKDARWSSDPVHSLCVALLTNAATDAQKLQHAAAALLEAREKARGPMMRLDAAAKRFKRVMEETQRGVRWILDEPTIAPYACVVRLNTDVIRERVMGSLGENLAAIITKRGAHKCPMCGRGKK
jgi:hypothetical protein